MVGFPPAWSRSLFSRGLSKLLVCPSSLPKAGPEGLRPSAVSLSVVP